jgi:hypothetical protein
MVLDQWFVATLVRVMQRQTRDVRSLCIAHTETRVHAPNVRVFLQSQPSDVA